MNGKAIYAVLMVYIGCGLNNVFLEYLVREDPGSGHLITFLQFLFIAAHGFIMTAKFGTVSPNIKIKIYAQLVFFFFITSVLNNWAFNFHIPVPLHMIFRAGSLIANMIMGIWILKKKYSASKFISVGMITVGIVICTLISSGKPKVCTNCDDDKPLPVKDEAEDFNLMWWMVGIAILTAALLLSARMGIFQESLYKVHGKYPEEALFYTHLLSLPLFVMNSGSIYDHYNVMMNSEPQEIPMLGIVLPILLIYMIGNVLTQYLCISSVYILTTECSSLTVTLVVTLRKFFSLILSIVYFQNPFTWAHWFGTLLVFVGTLIFTEVFSNIYQAIFPQQEKKKIS